MKLAVHMIRLTYITRGWVSRQTGVETITHVIDLKIINNIHLLTVLIFQIDLSEVDSVLRWAF